MTAVSCDYPIPGHTSPIRHKEQLKKQRFALYGKKGTFKKTKLRAKGV